MVSPLLAGVSISTLAVLGMFADGSSCYSTKQEGERMYQVCEASGKSSTQRPRSRDGGRTERSRVGWVASLLGKGTMDRKWQGEEE